MKKSTFSLILAAILVTCPLNYSLALNQDSAYIVNLPPITNLKPVKITNPITIKNQNIDTSNIATSLTNELLSYDQSRSTILASSNRNPIKRTPPRPKNDFAQYLKITRAYHNFNPQEKALFDEISRNFANFRSSFSIWTNLSSSQIALIAQVATAYNPVYSFSVDYKDKILKIYNIYYLESPEFIIAENQYLDSLIDSIPKHYNEIEKIYYVIRNISNFTFVHNTDKTNPLNPKNSKGIPVQIGYSLLNGGGVCSGFTDLTNKAMAKLGVPNRQVFGYLKTTPHTWNQVQVGGQWYNIESSGFSTSYNKKMFYCLDTFLVSNNNSYFYDYHTFDKNVFSTPNTDYLQQNPAIKQRLLNTFKDDLIIDNGRVDKDGYRDMIWNISDNNKY